MNLRTYRAYSMSQALAAVKRDLGEDAAVLHTREFFRGGFLGIGRKKIVEVTATTAREAKDRKRGHARAAAATKQSPNRVASRAYAGASGTSPDAVAKNRSARPAASTEERAMQLAEMLQRQIAETNRASATLKPTGPAAEATPRTVDLASHRVATTSSQCTPVAPVAARSAGSGASQSDPVSATPSLKESSTSVAESASSPRPRRFILTPADAPKPTPTIGSPSTASAKIAAAPQPHDVNEQESTRSDKHQHNVPATKERVPESEVTPPYMKSTESFDGERTVRNESPRWTEPVPSSSVDMMVAEIDAIRGMVGNVLAGQHGAVGEGSSNTADMPQHLFDIYLRLIGQDLSEELAEDIITAVRAEMSAVELEDASAVLMAVRRHVQQLVPVADTPVRLTSDDGRPLTIALIGPTGVGKTTTLAKLAATFKLRHGRRVGLITSDTYRIAAVDQLRTYANIIGLPLQVVLTPEDMAGACHQLRECDVILIDTAGRSQRDRDKLTELRRFLDVANPHEVHLVLSSTASEKVLMQEAEAFADVRADKVILTKLDEAVSFGMLVNVMRRVGKTLSFVTTGQEVPDHIEPGRAARLAELMLQSECDS